MSFLDIKEKDRRTSASRRIFLSNPFCNLSHCLCWLPDSGFDNNDNPSPSGRGGPGVDPEDNSRRYSAYAFNGKVVLGIGIILAVSAASAFTASFMSTSPVIRLSSGVGALQSASAQQAQTQQHVDKTFVLVAHNFGFNSTSGGPLIQVNKGDVVKIIFINAGEMAHNFGIAKLSPQTEALLNKTYAMPLDQRMNSIPYDVMAQMPCPGCETKFDEGHIETFVAPDNQVVTTFTASEAGHFKYFCEVRGHLWLGMIGDLVVLDKPSGLAPSGHTIQGTGQSNG